MNSVEPRINDWMWPRPSPEKKNQRKRTQITAAASATIPETTRNTRSGSYIVYTRKIATVLRRTYAHIDGKRRDSRVLGLVRIGTWSVATSVLPAWMIDSSV